MWPFACSLCITELYTQVSLQSNEHPIEDGTVSGLWRYGTRYHRSRLVIRLGTQSSVHRLDMCPTTYFSMQRPFDSPVLWSHMNSSQAGVYQRQRCLLSFRIQVVFKTQVLANDIQSSNFCGSPPVEIRSIWVYMAIFTSIDINVT
jgi:hypothetical protein